MTRREKRRVAIKEYLAKYPEKRMVRNARYRARQNNIPFNIEPSDLVIPKICPVLKIKIEIGANWENRWNSPSIDRIDNSKGYVKGNVEVISFRANALKRDATPSELKLLALYYGGRK
jgi:hypothetical protein